MPLSMLRKMAGCWQNLCIS